MPIIIRVTNDMFDFEKACCYMVNLVNLMGVSGKGLALEMRKRCPSHIEKYKEACKTKELRIGTVQVIEETEQSWGIINFPTKRHYANDSSLEDIARSLEALKDLLKTPRFRHCVIGMPIPGSGNGHRTYDEVYPLVIDYLGGLEATIILSMAPDKTEMRPRYLTIVGPEDYGQSDLQKQSIDWVIEKSLEKWGTTLDSYEGILSGGGKGVDRYICGEELVKNVEETYVFRKTGKPGIIIKPNLVRNSISAIRQRDIALCELAHDVILFKPKDHNNNRVLSMHVYLENDTQAKHMQGIDPKRVAIFGDRSLTRKEDNVIIPVQGNNWEE